jgi:6-phosphogluconolactonase
MRAIALGTVGVIAFFLLVGCAGGGGNSVTTPPPVVPQGSGPSSGNYLWEFNSDSFLYISVINSSSGIVSSPTIAGAPASNDNGSIPSLAATPSNAFLYALDTSLTLIRGFSVLGPGVKLSELSRSPFSTTASKGPLNALTLDPSGKFLYVIESPATIEEFVVNTATGDLAHGSAVTETADLRQAVIDPAGKFLFAIDLSGGRIFSYRTDGSNGSLSAAPGSPFDFPANGQPTHVLIERTSKFLYAILNTGGVAAFTIDISTGALTSVPGSPFPTGNEPSSIVVDPSGKFIYVCTLDGSIDGFAIDATSGALSAVMGSPFNTSTSPSSVVMTPSGDFLYVSIFPNSTIYGFRMDSSTGSLSALAGSPFPSVQNPTNLMSLKVP